ncbi:Putative Response regulator(Signal transduction response regulator, receiver domain,6-117) [Magnetospirillum sp. XM-1]|uniref:response regulator n=1 Tax=Magnetospirillum sp. XM-1 TaxID=1663591 RepID=UPI00073DE838|nr:response regulator [Magnetospirillum sp. XM-1]CUW38178.1 Putative Response regulator(Signal transduction response regulator, receiver domain,6-117) [Magnetospirillum sp. XM-1]
MPGARVLFVDDEPHVLDGIRRSMWSFAAEWEALFATGAVQALDILAKQDVHVVVTDIAMPVMDGKALIAEMYETYPNVVVLVLSGHWTSAVSRQQVGPAVRFLGKPVPADRLVAAIRAALSEVILTGLSTPAAKPNQALPAHHNSNAPNWLDMVEDG